MKKLTTGKIWQFAAGQFGWAMLSGIISNCHIFPVLDGFLYEILNGLW